MTNKRQHPWEKPMMIKALMDELASPIREPLLAAKLDPGAGIYCLWWASDRPSIIGRLGPYALGDRPVYLGSGASLQRRCRRYKQLLGELPGVDLDEIWISTVPCNSRASALFAESLALDALRPPLNEISAGLGSMRPGSGRQGQRAAVIDAIFAPGRPWSRPPSLAEQIRARCQLLACLARTDPAVPRWPALVSSPSEGPTRHPARGRPDDAVDDEEDRPGSPPSRPSTITVERASATTDWHRPRRATGDRRISMPAGRPTPNGAGSPRRRSARQQVRQDA